MQTIPTDQPLSVIELVMNSTPMAMGVLGLLFVFSVTSWAVILQKFFVFKSARREDDRFVTMFSKSDNLTNIYNFAQELRFSPVSRIFLIGYRELYLFQEMAKSGQDKDNNGKGAAGGTILLKDLKGIRLALNKAINREIERLSGRLAFLATTGSTTPFIGLFGTVWGVMHSFRAIGVAGTASIGGVAPGIAEALIATAAGLFAAIPAVVFYNYLNDKIRLFTSRMDDFAQDFLFMVEKNFIENQVEVETLDYS